MNTANLRNQILNELTESVENKRKAIKDFEDQARAEMLLSATVRGGLLSSTARSACESRAAIARQQANLIRKQNAWGEEMLKLYKK